MLFMILLCYSVPYVFGNSNSKISFIAHSDDEFPISIPHYPVRHDKDKRQAVSRGRFELLGGYEGIDGIDPNYTKTDLAQFRSTLQCAPIEPSLMEKIGFYKLIPYTYESLKVMCAYIESNGCSPWHVCHDKVKEYDQGRGVSNDLHSAFHYDDARLIRISKGKLYLDYPWKIERFRKADKLLHLHERYCINLLLKMVHLPDAVWFHSEEVLGYPYHVPLPSFSNSPSYKTSKSDCWICTSL